MKIGYNEAVTRENSTLDRNLALCEAAGFDYIELRTEMLNRYLAAGGSLGYIKDFFVSSRIKPSAFNALYTYQDLFGPNDDSARREAVLKQFHSDCEAIRTFGGQDYVIVPPLGQKGFMVPYDGDKEKVFDDCVRILTKLGEMADDYGVRLAFETVGAAKSSVRTVEMTYDIVRATGRDNVGLTIDSVNLYANGKLTDFSCIEKVPEEKIFIAHITDYEDLPLEDFTADNRCFCGSGVVPLEGFLTALKNAGYDGCVSVEIFRPEYWRMDPEWVVKEAYATTRKVMESAGVL